jgi:hypothetical protein
MPEYGTAEWREIGIEGVELEFGDFSPGRFAWELADVVRLPQPIMARGARGLWEWVESQ